MEMNNTIKSPSINTHFKNYTQWQLNHYYLQHSY